MNYALLAVASLRSKRAPFPLNNPPPTPTTLEVACVGAKAPHAIYYQINLEQILKFMSVHIKASE